MTDEFENALKIIFKRIRTPLEELPDSVKQNVQEIRLRANMPLCLTVSGKNMFVSGFGSVTDYPDNSTVICDRLDIAQTFAAACEYSVYAYQDEINQGFVTVSGGDRIGVCGTAVLAADGINNSIKNVKNISSLNIRIAREHKFCSSAIIDCYKKHGLMNTLIIGAPSSGKTTMLRDIVYQLSSGKSGQMLRICAVDERYEICGTNSGVSAFDLGLMCDILSGFPKAEGIITALRTQNPQVIVFDEISTNAEMTACAQGFAAGSYIITSVHSSGLDDFLHRRVCQRLLDCGIFRCFVFLGDTPGKIERIMSAKEIKDEACRNHND